MKCKICNKEIKEQKFFTKIFGICKDCYEDIGEIYAEEKELMTSDEWNDLIEEAKEEWNETKKEVLL